MVVPPAFQLDHVDHGIDQGQVSEGLREVPEVLTGVRVDFFAVKLQCTRESQQFGAELPGALVFPDFAQCRDEPEGSDSKAALLPLEPVIGFVDPIAQHQIMHGELVGNRQYSRFDDRVVGRQEAHQRCQE